MNAIDKVNSFKSDKLTVINITNESADVIYHGIEYKNCKVEVFGANKEYVFIETNYPEVGDGPIINTTLIK